MKAVIDTNVIISSFISSTGLPRQLIKSGEEIRFDWLLSNGMYLELADVLFRPIIREKYNIEPTFRSFGKRFSDYYLLHLILVLPHNCNRGKVKN
jgi:predicted nucleic acid-binding protein